MSMLACSSTPPGTSLRLVSPFLSRLSCVSFLSKALRNRYGNSVASNGAAAKRQRHLRSQLRSWVPDE